LGGGITRIAHLSRKRKKPLEKTRRLLSVPTLNQNIGLQEKRKRGRKKIKNAWRRRGGARRH